MSDIEAFIRFCESDFGTTVMDREARYLKKHIDISDRILDVGCGIGSLEERLESYDVLGIDQSEEMVHTARHRTGAHFFQGDARSLPFATGAFDAVVFVATLEFIPDVNYAISEAIRVLDPDGTFIALVLNTRSEYVNTNLQREGSYFERMVHRKSEELTDAVLDRIDGTREYFLGIDGESVFESCDPASAAITAVVGSPAQQS